MKVKKYLSKAFFMFPLEYKKGALGSKEKIIIDK